MKCTIEIQMDNSAFTDDPGSELARILRNFASRVENAGKLFDGATFSAFDYNGNRVGALLVEVEELAVETKEELEDENV